MNQNDINIKLLLDMYLNKLNCSAKELAKASNLSESIISRYRNEKKIVKINNKHIEKIINGIIKLTNQKKNINISIKELNDDFSSITNPTIDYDTFINNFNLLIKNLNINVANLAKNIGYDPSYISKIRNGSRKINYINEFVDTICNYVFSTYKDNNSLNQIKLLLDNNKITNDNLKTELKKWLCTNLEIENNNTKINHFLQELNDFNLNDYIKVINFNNFKIPSFPINIPKSKIYYGLEEMKQGEIDFFKSSILDSKTKKLFMYNEMPMEDLAEDIDFGKKWMYVVAVMLKKGIHLNIIHNLNRSFNEIMLGLECWIPIYMTGLVNPYHFTSNTNKLYLHLNYVSDNYALAGECIVNNHEKGKYYLTNNKNEVKYYKEQASLLLKKAKPLMKIYTNDNLKELVDFYHEDINTLGNRKRILCNLPIHTISNNLLSKIIKKSNLKTDDIFIIENYINEEKNIIKKILENNNLIDEITLLSKEDFDKYNISLNLDTLNKKIKLKYEYEDYVNHFEETKKYKNKNYKLVITNNKTFNNIDIYINSNKYVLISKKNNPSIHFLIKHEKLIDAIDKFTPLVKE